jgi:hypothetical protein
MVPIRARQDIRAGRWQGLRILHRTGRALLTFVDETYGMRSASLTRSVVACLLATAAMTGTAHAHVSTGTNLVPRQGALFGAFVNRSTSTWAAVTSFQKSLGFKLTIVHHYQPWSIGSLTVERAAMNSDQIPMLSWSPGGTTTANAIVSGSQDALIRRTALAIKALHKRMFLRLGYEMDQPPGHPRYIGTPSQFIAAWRHVVSIFRNVGATNARFVWCAIAANFKNGHAQAYYPGDAWVNWIAADGYNWYPSKSTWATFGTIFPAFYHWGAAHARPLMIAETGSMEDRRTPGRKAAWMTSARLWVRAHPKIRAVVYFDSVSPKGFDFRSTTSSSAFAALRRWGLGSYWNPM